MGCWFVGGDLTAALHDLWLQLSSPPPSSFASIKPANPGSPGKWPLKWRERATSENRHVELWQCNESPVTTF